MKKIANNTDTALKKSTLRTSDRAGHFTENDFHAHSSLLGKLSLFGAAILGFLLLAFMMTNRYSKNMIRENILSMNEKILLQINGKVEDYYSSVNHLATALAYSPTSYAYFTQSTKERILALEDLSTVFSNIVLVEENIVGIYFYDTDLNQIAGMGAQADQPEQVDQLYEEMKFSDLYYRTDGGARYLVYYPVYDIKSKQYGRQIGMCILVMENADFDSMLEDGQATEHTQICLVDGGGQIVAMRGAEGVNVLTDAQMETDDAYYVQTQDLCMAGWKVVSRIPEQELYGSTDQMGWFITAAYVIALVLLVLLIYFCYRCMVLPLSQVEQFIRRNMDDPQARLPEDRSDEIGTVIISLNHMLDEKDRMSQEVQQSQKRMYEAELARQRMEILAYRNQMNPHFLYNTLEAMREMALIRNAPDVAEIAVDMGNIFRYNTKGGYEVSLEEEVAITRAYIRIQQKRFRGKIDVHYYISEEALSLKVIKLLLQPMVENAIIHGLEKKMDVGSLFIGARIEEDKLVLTVKDDGTGIVPEQLKKIRQELRKPDVDTSRHVGIINTNARIRLYYGGEYGVTIESRTGDGTTVTMLLPAQKSKTGGL